MIIVIDLLLFFGGRDGTAFRDVRRSGSAGGGSDCESEIQVLPISSLSYVSLILKGINCTCINVSPFLWIHLRLTRTALMGSKDHEADDEAVVAAARAKADVGNATAQRRQNEGEDGRRGSDSPHRSHHHHHEDHQHEDHAFGPTIEA